MELFDSFYISEAGADADENEDFVVSDQQAGIFAVADGLGGRPAGGKASRAGAQAFLQAVRRLEPSLRLDDACLRRAVEESNAVVRSLAGADPLAAVPGTTLCAAVLNGQRGKIVHAGDSRAYLFADGRLRQLTTDHTLVEELILHNHLTRETAKDYPLRHVLSKCLGTDRAVEPDVQEITLSAGAWLLLATDGLAAALTNDQLEGILGRQVWRNAEELCRCVVDQALSAVPGDNTSVLVVRAICKDDSEVPTR